MVKGIEQLSETRENRLTVINQEGEEIPITQKIWEDPSYTRQIIGLALALGQEKTEAADPLVTRTRNTLNHFIERFHSEKDRYPSIVDLMHMVNNDDPVKIHGRPRGMGDKSLDLINQGLQELRGRLKEGNVS